MGNYFNRPVSVKLFLILCFFVFALKPLFSITKEHKIESDSLSAEWYFNKANNYFEISDLDKAIYYYKKAADLFKTKNSWDYFVKSKIQIAEYYRINNDNEKAIKTLLSTEKIVKNYLKNSNRTIIDLYHKIGAIYYDNKDVVNSKHYLKLSINLRIKYYDKYDTALALSYNSLGNNFYLTNLDSALKYYKKAIDIGLLKKNKEDSDNAMFYQNIGIIYARKGDFDKSKEFLSKSLRINNKILPENDYRLAKINLNVARFNYLLEDYNSALEANNRAETIYLNKFGKNYYSLGTIYLNKGNIYNDLIDYEKALEFYKHTLSIYQAQDNPDYSSIAKVYNNIGSVYTQMKEYDKALNYYKKTLSIKRNIVSKIITYRNIAKVNIRMKNFDKANYYYTLAIDSAKKYIGENHYESGNNYRGYAEFFVKTGKWERGKKFMLKALNIYSKIYDEKNTNITEVLALIGDYYCKVENYELAVIYFHRSILSSVVTFSNKDYMSNPAIYDANNEYELLYPLYRKAYALMMMYQQNNKDIKHLEFSVQTYKLAIALIDKIEENLTEGSNFLLAENIQDIFYNSIKTSLFAYNITKNPVFLETTYQFIEKNKAAILLSSIRSEDAIKYAGISEKSQKLESQFKKRINAYKKQIFDQMNLQKPDKGKISLWESKLLYLHKSYDSLIARFEIKNPEYYALKYDTSFINTTEIKKYIGKNKALIQYSVFENEIYSSIITSDSVLIVSKSIDSIFFHQIDFIYKMFSIDMSTHNFDDYITYILYSNNLYRILFEPFNKLIRNKDLIIIPDGRLGYLPFETLITKIPDLTEINYRTLPYLLREHAISYSPSATILLKENFRDDIIDDIKILAVAPSYDNNVAIEKNHFLVNNKLTNNIIPLKQAKYEVDNISKIYPSTKCKNLCANKDKFLELAPDYDVLHLAMHTIINDTAPMYSKLIFTPSDNDSVDIFLNTYEIYNMDLKARMVVLSACNTGSGKLQKGEGILSLSRGFIYCGVPSIIMTLWEVNDRSGADIMSNFYSNLKEGLPKDKALQMAKLHYLENAKQFRSHPYFWSQYVCIGNVEAISTKPLNPNKIVLFVLVFIVIIISVFYLRKKIK